MKKQPGQYKQCLRSVFDGVSIFRRQTRTLTGCQACAAGSTSAGHNDKQVTAQTGNVIFDLFLNAKAQTDHGNNSADTDNDAQERQQCTQLIGKSFRQWPF